MTKLSPQPKPLSKEREFPPDGEAETDRGTDRRPPIPTPEPSDLGAEKLAPDEPRPKPPGRKVEPLSPEEQRRRFEELSRELGTDSGETLDRVFGKIVPPKARHSSSELDVAPDPQGKIRSR